jgi:hypothetical protein
MKRQVCKICGSQGARVGAPSDGDHLFQLMATTGSD